MSRKPTAIIGLSLADFKILVNKGQELHMQSARLIPLHKPGDEMALSSIILSALRLVDEFRKDVFREINLSISGTIHIYNEVEFLLFNKKRIDGLLLVVRGKNIADAVLIEVKNKNNEIDEKQISDYVDIAKAYKIPKLLTISNQFVSFPTQSPVSIKTPKSVSLYHFSWSYLLTIAHILLFENENNIADQDQVEIMKEVVEYFESKNSGIVGFTQMKQGWSDIVRKTNAGISLLMNDNSVEETVSSWLQEERDMALMLSRNLGLLVKSGQKKYKDNLKARIEYEKRELISNKFLESSLQIEGAASNITVRPIFDRRNIEMSVTLLPPQDRKTRSQITWLKNQIKACERKNTELFRDLKNDILIDVNIKYIQDPIRCNLEEFADVHEQVINKEIRSFNILLLKNLGRKFESRKGFVAIIESMLIDFYKGIVQHIKKWHKPVPQIQNASENIEQV